MSNEYEEKYVAAAKAIASAQALIIGAGAGMGVDSGLPDFRGDTGFWEAYPVYGQHNKSFSAMANPTWFKNDPAMAWGFYGHRLELYRDTVPHQGFQILRKWGERMQHGYFVFTSNVDGQFQKAGFDSARIAEIHGSIHQMQCTANCGVGIIDAAPFQVNINMETMRAAEPLPTCPKCGALLRPNIMMFGDWGWDSQRTQKQENRLHNWMSGLRSAKAQVVVIELGAGTAIPSVRSFCENESARTGTTLIRINLRDYKVPSGAIGLSSGALEALTRLDVAQG